MAEQTRDVERRSPASIAADALTISRFGIALAIAVTVGLWDALTVGTLLLCVAWLSDFADGQLARLSPGTRLGRWDPIADAVVGVGVLVGLAVADRISVVPWIVLGALLMAGFLVSRNLSLGMVLQAISYGLLIVELAIDASGALWMLGATVAVIAIADGRRFTEVVLPTFFAGLGLSRRRGPGPG